MLEISNYILIYIFHISPKLIRLCRLQINTKLPVQFMIGGRKADQMGKKSMHVIYIGERQKCLGSSGEKMMALSVTFSLWKLQYIPWEDHLPCYT